MRPKEFYAHVRSLVAAGNVDLALQVIQSYLRNGPEYDEFLHLAGRLATIRKQIRLGKISDTDATIAINQIQHVVLELVSMMEKKEAQADPRSLNEQLTRAIIEAIRPYCKPAQNFLKQAAAYPEWEREGRISDKAKEIIAFSFVGVIGIQLSKLMAIGKEEHSPDKPRKYLEKCLHIAKHSFSLVNFALLSQLWDAQRDHFRHLTENQKQVIRKCFDTPFELTLPERLQLLRVLHNIFSLPVHRLAFPIQELKGLDLSTESELEFIATELQGLNARLEDGSYNLLDCITAERLLADFFRHFHFLANYRMASIKRIGYQQLRFSEPAYLHRYTALGIDSKANIDAEKVNYTTDTTHTDAVLLYQGEDYRNSINLSPFIIDYNALTFEHGARICFFQNTGPTDEILEYVFLEDNGSVRITFSGTLKPDADYNELMLHKDTRQELNLDHVVQHLNECRRILLEADQPNFDDL